MIQLGLSNNTLDIQYLEINGLDSFTNLTIMKPSTTSGAVLTNELGMKDMKLNIYLEFNYSNSQDVVITEDIKMTIDLNDVLILLDVVVALSEEIMSDIYVDQYLNNSDCLYLALDELSISSLDISVNIGEISLTQLDKESTIVNEDVVVLLNNIAEWLINSWPLSDLITGLGQTTIKETINEVLENKRLLWQEQATRSCQQHVEAIDVDYMNWNSSNKINQLNNIIQVIGVDGVNNFMTCLTGGTGEVTIMINNNINNNNNNNNNNNQQ